MRVLLVDDHALVREGLALLIGAVDASAQVLQAASIDQALLLLAPADEAAAVDLVLLDLAMPGVVGLDGLHRVRAVAEGVPLVVLSGNEQAATMHECIEAGAMGFIPKSADSAAMFKALRLVLDGHVYLPQLQADVASGPAAEAERLGRLTPRQREVLACVVQGMSNKRIAQRLGITELTVKSHVGAVLEALGVANRTEAVFAVRDWRPGLPPQR